MEQELLTPGGVDQGGALSSQSLMDPKVLQLLQKLLGSLQKTQPIHTEEASLIDKFVMSHQSVYSLPSQLYKQMLIKIVENRLDKESSGELQHQMRIYQCIRILTREESIAVSLTS